MNKTYILAIPDECQHLAKELSMYSAKIYSKAVTIAKKRNLSFEAIVRYMEFYNHKKHLPLHSQSKQASYQQFLEAYKAYLKKLKEAKKKNAIDTIKPPYRQKKYNKVVYKDSAIHYKNDALILSNGKGNPAIVIPNYPFNQKPKYAELVYHSNKKKYYLHVVVEAEEKQLADNSKVLAVDLGVIHPVVAYDGERVIIYNGGILNSKVRYRNKKIAEFQEKLAKCQKNSRRYKKLTRAKRKTLTKINNQIRDVLQKYTSHLIGYCVKNGISVIAVGDVTNIRKKVNYNKKSNQKIHQWLFRKIAKLLEYKAKLAGIELVKVKENYTSQTCPACGRRNKTNNRNYSCKCGFSYHRDGVGVVNIYKKYTGLDALVVGPLACPTGVRYIPHLCCPAEWNTHPVGKTA